jgi:hypothetical protein
MNYTILIAKLQVLPEEKQAEVFDFVDYLAERFSRRPVDQAHEWSETDFSEFSMEQAMRGLEDEPPLYGESDLKERWR